MSFYDPGDDSNGSYDEDERMSRNTRDEDDSESDSGSKSSGSRSSRRSSSNKSSKNKKRGAETPASGPKTPSTARQGGSLGEAASKVSGTANYARGAQDLRQGNFTRGSRTILYQAAQDGIKQGAKTLLASPWTWLVIGIILVIILIVVLLSRSSNNCNQAQQPPDTLTIKTAGPQTAKNGDVITYTFTIADTQQDTDITVIAHLPDGVSLAPQDVTSSWNKMQFDPAAKTVTWKASANLATTSAQLANQQGGNNQPVASNSAGGNLPTSNSTFTLTLKSIADNTNLITYADATPTRNGTSQAAPAPATGGQGGCPGSADNTGGGAPVAGFVPANKTNCPGQPALNSNPIGNYGNPGCSFDKDKLHALLQQKDPANADKWFVQIAPCESSYNPNAYELPADAVDKAGGWGLFQMGSATPQGAPPPAPGKNGPDDRGDVNWELQVANATSHQQAAGNWNYWACAKK